MVEQVYCELTHDTIDEHIKELKDKGKDHEGRIVLLEKISHARDVQIDNILEGMKSTNKSIDSLVGWIKWGLAFLVPSSIGFAIWLLQQQLVR